MERSHQPCRAEKKTYSTVCCSGAGRWSSSRDRERFTSVTLRVAVTLEKLSVPWQPLEPRRQPLSRLQSRVRGSPLPLLGQPHLPTGRGHPANREPVRDAGVRRDGSCGPGDGASPAAAGARRHPAAGGAEGGGRAAGTAAFPGPAGSPAPLLCPSRASAMNSLSRLSRSGGEGGRYRAKETYILCGHR